MPVTVKIEGSPHVVRARSDRRLPPVLDDALRKTGTQAGRYKSRFGDLKVRMTATGGRPPCAAERTGAP
jgi:aerobic-type carbon monoxide dehydrogenase small subunit (CoxS/CutS family)